jgi:TatD DNase family protein
VVDSHTHLDMCDPPDAELVAAALDAGVNRIVTIGIDGAASRTALAAAEDFPQVYAAVGRHPNSATGFDDADLAELAALAAHPKCVAIGETGLDFYRDYAPRADQERAFRAQIELARSVGKPLVIHTRDASDETLALLNAEAEGVRVILHCFSMAERIEECLAHDDWWISFAGNVTYPKASALRTAALRVPATRLLVETDALALDLTSLDPAPTAVVANLPYSIAATVILRTIDELPSVGKWVVMVQREVGERLAASAGEPAYGAPSVLAQLACEVRVLRPVSRTVFRPVPRVDSVLVGLRRLVGVAGVDPDVRALVHDAFAHRRKALARSLALAPGAAPGVRERAREALVELGHPADERAERLSPAEFRELAAMLRVRA